MEPIVVLCATFKVFFGASVIDVNEFFCIFLKKIRILCRFCLCFLRVHWHRGFLLQPQTVNRPFKRMFICACTRVKSSVDHVTRATVCSEEMHNSYAGLRPCIKFSNLVRHAPMFSFPTAASPGSLSGQHKFCIQLITWCWNDECWAARHRA